MPDKPQTSRPGGVVSHGVGAGFILLCSRVRTMARLRRVLLRIDTEYPGPSAFSAASGIAL